MLLRNSTHPTGLLTHLSQYSSATREERNCRLINLVIQYIRLVS